MAQVDGQLLETLFFFRLSQTDTWSNREDARISRGVMTCRARRPTSTCCCLMPWPARCPDPFPGTCIGCKAPAKTALMVLVPHPLLLCLQGGGGARGWSDELRRWFWCALFLDKVTAPVEYDWSAMGGRDRAVPVLERGAPVRRHQQRSGAGEQSHRKRADDPGARRGKSGALQRASPSPACSIFCFCISGSLALKLLQILQVWDTMSYTVTARLRHAGAVYCLAASPGAVTACVPRWCQGARMSARQREQGLERPPCAPSFVAPEEARKMSNKIGFVGGGQVGPVLCGME